ncbi:sugar phosphate isomerase/epimerase family protein [Rubrobacter xylanophilus]|uniref:sugar phosphate isomerase/epimerase family protein n=1 Tax=Rubrobacter xylanophilus TaxID=49319 RepID=UPI001C63C2ED|nr:TIM barrel protein [Rubrobacter xylanophilus]
MQQGGLKYAVHAYAWTSSWSSRNLDILDRAKSLGLDTVEIPLMELEAVDTAAIRERAVKQGLEVLASVAVDQDTDPTGESAAVRDRARYFLKRCVERTAEMGATVFTGVTYSAIGRRIDRRPGMEDFRRSAEVLEDVARYAAGLGFAVDIGPVTATRRS